MSEKQTYEVIYTVEHNGELYKQGSEISLSTEDAAGLLACDAIREYPKPAAKQEAEPAASQCLSKGQPQHSQQSQQPSQKKARSSGVIYGLQSKKQSQQPSQCLSKGQPQQNQKRAVKSEVKNGLHRQRSPDSPLWCGGIGAAHRQGYSANGGHR